MEERTITATCVREMSINASPYNIRLSLDPSSRKPTDIWCGCVSGFQGKCKHVAALIEAINVERTTSQTDEAKTWLAPSAQVQRLYPKGETVQELVTGKKPQQSIVDASSATAGPSEFRMGNSLSDSTIVL